MTRYTFAKLDPWATKTKARMDYTASAATQKVAEEMQRTVAKGGRMPVLSGVLRNSLQTSVEGGQVAGGESYNFVAGTMEAGDVARFRYGAEYAAAVNDGRMGREGRRFQEGAVDQWPGIVEGVIAAAKARLP